MYPQCTTYSCFSKFSGTTACTALTNFPTRNKIIALRKEKQISFQFLDIHMHLEFGKQDKMGPDYIGGNICWGCYSAIFFHMIYL
jgi:hypothetical protein